MLLQHWSQTLGSRDGRQDRERSRVIIWMPAPSIFLVTNDSTTQTSVCRLFETTFQKKLMIFVTIMTLL